MGLAGCQLAPPPQVPTAPAVAGYTRTAMPATLSPANGPAQTLVVGREPSARWWEAYGSAKLDRLVEQAVAASPDLAAAEAALRAARETAKAARGALLPTVDANYSLSRQQVSKEISSPLANNADLFTLHTLQVTVGYTPDVFGAQRYALAGAAAQAEGQRLQGEAAYLTLTSNVVAAVVQRASLAAQVREAEALVASCGRSLEGLRRQRSLGEAAGPDVLAQETVLAQARQALPGLRRQLAAQDDLLAILTGHTPSGSAVDAPDLEELVLPAELPVSLPSELVHQRPDIRAAEANLNVAGAAVGAAIAARLPSFPLSAAAGGQATDLSRLLSSGDAFWTLTGGATQPIFHGGQLKHKQRAAEAQLDQAKAQYRSAVMTALQNVADTLEALRQDADAVDAAAAVEGAAGRAQAAAERQLRAGEGSSLALLTAEQAQIQSRGAVVQARAQRLADTAALFQAMGGGWRQRDDFPAAGPSKPQRPR